MTSAETAFQTLLSTVYLPPIYKAGHHYYGNTILYQAKTRANRFWVGAIILATVAAVSGICAYAFDLGTAGVAIGALSLPAGWVFNAFKYAVYPEISMRFDPETYILTYSSNGRKVTLKGLSRRMPGITPEEMMEPFVVLSEEANRILEARDKDRRLREQKAAVTMAQFEAMAEGMENSAREMSRRLQVSKELS